MATKAKTNAETDLCAQIAKLHEQYQTSLRTTVVTASKIGEALIELKKLTKHGNWKKYVQDHLPFSNSTAQRYMAIFSDKRILEQKNPNWQTELSYTEALKALAEAKAEDQKSAETKPSSKGQTAAAAKAKSDTSTKSEQQTVEIDRDATAPEDVAEEEVNSEEVEGEELETEEMGSADNEAYTPADMLMKARANVDAVRAWLSQDEDCSEVADELPLAQRLLEEVEGLVCELRERQGADDDETDEEGYADYDSDEQDEAEGEEADEEPEYAAYDDDEDEDDDDEKYASRLKQKGRSGSRR